MIRALAFCAVISVIGVASAQTVTPRIITDQASGSEPTIALPDDAPISACGKQECPVPSGETANAEIASDKPIDDHALLRQKLAEMNCLLSEIDSLRVATGTPQQLRVDVQVIEINRTAVRAAGIDMSSFQGQAVDAKPQASILPGALNDAGFSTGTNRNAIHELVDTLCKANVCRVVAEPSIVTISGRPTSIHIGGEVPLPSAPGAEKAVEYKKFGTEVDLLATAIGEQRVKLDVRVRVSAVNHSRGVEVNGRQVPEVSVQQVNAPIELEIGQTGVMTGLVTRRTEALRTSAGITNKEHQIELLFLVTPTVQQTNLAQTGSGDTVVAEQYRTANSASEPNPDERSLRVSKPYTPR